MVLLTNEGSTALKIVQCRVRPASPQTPRRSQTSARGRLRARMVVSAPKTLGTRRSRRVPRLEEKMEPQSVGAANEKGRSVAAPALRTSGGPDQARG
jgi:hypothetical protein